METNEKKEIINVITEMKKQLEDFHNKLCRIESKLKVDETKDICNSSQCHSPIKPIQDRKNSF